LAASQQRQRDERGDQRHGGGGQQRDVHAADERRVSSLGDRRTRL
jgi:hypothetical protein